MSVDEIRLKEQVEACLERSKAAPEEVRIAVWDALTDECRFLWADWHYRGDILMMDCPRCANTGRERRLWNPDPTETAELAAWFGRLGLVWRAMWSSGLSRWHYSGAKLRSKLAAENGYDLHRVLDWLVVEFAQYEGKAAR